MPASAGNYVMAVDAQGLLGIPQRDRLCNRSPTGKTIEKAVEACATQR
ncbi:MAG: hypothetical protein RJA36_69 [Pseudomonadota bacterium]|jgi:hypothetical protein